MRYGSSAHHFRWTQIGCAGLAGIVAFAFTIVFPTQGSLQSRHSHLASRSPQAIICQNGSHQGCLDDRIPMSAQLDFPGSTVGKIRIIPGEAYQDWEPSACTGTLVGRQTVLTAAHCLMVPARMELYQAPLRAEYLPFYRNGPYVGTQGPGVARLDVSRAITGIPAFVAWYQQSRSRGTLGLNQRTIEAARRTLAFNAHDWAVIPLERPLGDSFGYMHVTPRSALDLIQRAWRMTAIGYPLDFPGPELLGLGAPGEVASVQFNCRFEGVGEQGLLFHDCDSGFGSSGGPIYQLIGPRRNHQAELYAIHSAHDTDCFPGDAQRPKDPGCHFAERLRGQSITARNLAVPMRPEVLEAIRTLEASSR